MSRRLAVAAVVLLVLEALVAAFLGRGELDNKGKGVRVSKTAAAHRVKARPEVKEMVADHLVRAMMMMTRAISNLEASPVAAARPTPAKVQETTMALVGASLEVKVAAPQLREQTMMDPDLDNLGTVKALPATVAKAAMEMPLGVRVTREVNQVQVVVLQVMPREGNLAQDPRAPARLAQVTILVVNLVRLEMVLVATAKTAREGLAQTAAALMEPTTPQTETEMLMGATPLAAVAAMMEMACLTEPPTMGTNLAREGPARTDLALKELGLGAATASLPIMEDRGVPLLEGVAQEATLTGVEALTTGETALLDLAQDLGLGLGLVQEMALLRIRVEELQAPALLAMTPPVTTLQAMALPDLIREVVIRLLIRVGEFRAPVLLMMALLEMALLEMALLEMTLLEMTLLEMALLEMTLLEMALLEMALLEMTLLEMALLEMALLEMTLLEMALLEMTLLEMALLEMALLEMTLLEMDQEMTVRTRAGEFRAAALRVMTLEKIHPQAMVHQATDPEAHHHQEPDPSLEAAVQEERRTRTAAAQAVVRMAAQGVARMAVPTEVQAAPTAAPTAGQAGTQMAARAEARMEARMAVPTVVPVEAQAALAGTQMAAPAEGRMVVRMAVRMAVPTEAPTEALEADQTPAALGLEMETPAATAQGMDQTTGEEQIFPALTIPNACLKVAWMATAALFRCRVDARESCAAQMKSAMMEAAAVWQTLPTVPERHARAARYVSTIRAASQEALSADRLSAETERDVRIKCV
ncbi:hypothetical protein FSOLCH5_006455 [Fusarium solani]